MARLYGVRLIAILIKKIHMVSAWASENGFVLGQTKAEEKLNEITAIPKLLKTLELTGCIVTIDAMECQKKIAKVIIKKEADYLFLLKGNQSSIHKDNAPENFAVLRHIALNLLKNEKTFKGSIKTKRLMAGLEISCLEKIVGENNFKTHASIGELE